MFEVTWANAIDNMLAAIPLALGVFVGNWLIVPLFLKRSFKDGFFIGLIAAVLVFIFTSLFKL